MASVYVVVAELFDGPDEILFVGASSQEAESFFYDERYTREGDGDTDLIRLEVWIDGKKADDQSRYSFLNEEDDYDWPDWDEEDEDEDIEDDFED